MVIDHAIQNHDRLETFDAPLARDKASMSDQPDIHPQIYTDRLEDERASLYAKHLAMLFN